MSNVLRTFAVACVGAAALAIAGPSAAATLQSSSGDPQPGSLLGWLQCRAAASRFIEMVEQSPAHASRDPARRAEAQTMIARARDLDARAGRQAAAMNLTGRSSSDMAALQAPFSRQFATSDGAARLGQVMQACEAELNGGQ